MINITIKIFQRNQAIAKLLKQHQQKRLTINQESLDYLSFSNTTPNATHGK